AHREHPVREHRRVTGGLHRETLVGVHRVEVARRSRVLDDLRPGQAADEHQLPGLAPRHGRHAAPPTFAEVVTVTIVAVTTSSPRWSRYSVILSVKVSVPPRRPSLRQVLPGRSTALSTSPWRTGRWYSYRCSACRPRPAPPAPGAPEGAAPDPSHGSPGLGRTALSGS